MSVHQRVDERSTIAEHVKEEGMFLELEVLQQSEQRIRLLLEHTTVTAFKKLLHGRNVANRDAPLIFVYGAVLRQVSVFASGPAEQIDDRLFGRREGELLVSRREGDIVFEIFIVQLAGRFLLAFIGKWGT